MSMRPSDDRFSAMSQVRLGGGVPAILRQTMDVPQVAEPMQLRHVWKLIRERLWLIAVCTISLTSLVALYVLRTPNYYDARSRVEINPERSEQIIPGGAPIPDDPSYLNTELQTITSPRLLARVAKALNLENDPVFLRHIPHGGRMLRRLLHLTYLGKTFNDEAGDSAALPIDAGLKPSVSQADLLEAKRLEPFVSEIKRRITLEPIKETRSLFRETRLVDIVVRHPSPAMAAKLANAIGEALVVTNREQHGEADRLRTDNLMRRALELQGEIRNSEAKLSDYGKSHDILSLEPGQNTAVERLVTLNKQLLEAQNDLRLAEANYDTARSPEGGAALAEENVKNQIADTEVKLTDLRAKRAQMLVTVTDKWPEVQEVTRQIEVLEQRLKDIRAQGVLDVVSTLGAHYREVQAREQAQHAAFDQQRSLVQNQNQAAVTYRLIQQEVETNKQILNGLLVSLGASEALKAGTFNNLRVVDYAIMPDPNEPAGPMRFIYIALAASLALGAAISGALVLGHLDNTLRSDEDVRLVLNTRTLGEIGAVRVWPTAFLRVFRRTACPSPELLIGSDAASHLSEDYRRIRTSVMLSSSRPARLKLLITSSVPGEGKTTTAVNVAVSLVQTGARVLLVDSDLRCPRLHKVFNIDISKGLGTVLSGSISPLEASSLVARHEATGIHVLASGPPSGSSAELLGSDKIGRLLEAFQSQFDYVILDAPAVESCVDALILAPHVDGVVMVVLSGKSSRQVVLRSLQALDDSGGKLLGVVLNRANTSERRRYMNGDRYRVKVRAAGA